MFHVITQNQACGIGFQRLEEIFGAILDAFCLAVDFLEGAEQRFDDIASGEDADQAILCIEHRHPSDFRSLEATHGLHHRLVGAGDNQFAAGHKIPHRAVQLAVFQRVDQVLDAHNARQRTVLDHRDARNVMLAHQFLQLAHQRIRGDRKQRGRHHPRDPYLPDQFVDLAEAAVSSQETKERETIFHR